MPPNSSSAPDTVIQEAAKNSYVKLAMRNMVKKGSTSLLHFAITLIGVVGLLIGLSILFH